MPPGGDFEGRNPLANALFGAFQAAAARRATTADVWRDLRIAAARTQRQILGETEQLPETELERIGAGLLRQNGLTIGVVNRYRGIAGEWLHAKQRLHRLGEGDQITSAEIFTPPWARTRGGETPSRYRVRIKWATTGPDETEVSGWASFETERQLTSTSDLLGETQRFIAGKQYPAGAPSAEPAQVADFEIEQL